MRKSPNIEEVINKTFGVFTIKGSFSAKKNKYFVCECGNCGSIVNKSWWDILNKPNIFCNNCRTAPVVKPRGAAALNRLLKIYRDAAKKRDIKWDLSLEEFKSLTSSDCFYCGIEPKQKVGGLKNKKGKYKLNGNYLHNGIDRLDSNKCYTINNCVPCCKYCNLGKNDQTYTEYINRIRSIYIKHCSREK